MNKYSVDYSVLANQISRQKYYKYEQVKDKLVKVAFDVVRFIDSEDIDGLWQIQNTDDGEVIVAMYEQGEPKEASASWKAIADKTGTVNVFYKSTPVTKIALASVGVPKEDAHLICETVASRLESDPAFRASLMNNLSDSDRSELLRAYPEILGQI